MKKLLFAISFLTLITGFAAENTFEVTITNITKSQIFAPPIVISHNLDYKLFELGQPASMALYTMAEDGDNSFVYADSMADENVFDVVRADGPLMPGQSVTLEISVTYLNTYVTVAGMLVSSNDGFFALDSASLRVVYFKGAPRRINTFMAYVYDSGSEANTESCDHIPGPPCGSGGVRVTDGAEGYVYPHAGLHGAGDLSVRDFDWSGPAAKIEFKRVQ